MLSMNAPAARAQARTTAAALLASAWLLFEPLALAAPPKPLEPQHALKPAAGYFDEAFALEPGGTRLYVVRTDGATFAKLELIDLATGKTTSSFDLPAADLAVERLEPLADGKGVVLILREGLPEAPSAAALLLDATGKVVKKVGPANAFGRPGATPPLLVAFDRRSGSQDGDVTYTITPYQLDTLTAVGKPRVYKTAGGMLKSPAFRILDFADGYSRVVGERPRAYDKKSDVRQPVRMAVLDTLTGKLVQEAEIADVMAWLQVGKLRARHPGHNVFADLNPDDSGVDVVDAMGNQKAADVAIAFDLYDPKTLRDQEGPEPGALYFGIGVDPLNAAAIKRQKPDLPMLDLYAFNVAKGTTSLRARVFTPRPTTWRAGYGKLVVLKRFKSFTRGGDELDVYQLH